MKQIGIRADDLSSLRTLTQSGGRLPDEIALWLLNEFGARGTDIYFMYGMTEAAGRMTVLRPELARERLGSVGQPVASASVAIDPDGQIVYRGPNVMLGYAGDRSDLAAGDRLGGTLHTGDIGRLDGEGFLYITGRRHRYSKILGTRLDLDGVQSMLQNAASVVAVSDDERLGLFTEGPPPDILIEEVERLARDLCLPRHLIVVRGIDRFPATSNGKIAYAELTRMLRGRGGRN